MRKQLKIFGSISGIFSRLFCVKVVIIKNGYNFARKTLILQSYARLTSDFVALPVISLSFTKMSKYL